VKKNIIVALKKAKKGPCISIHRVVSDSKQGTSVQNKDTKAKPDQQNMRHPRISMIKTYPLFGFTSIHLVLGASI
jgi:hypothetical protein